MQTNPYILALVLVFVFLAGYWARRYLEKKYPDRVTALDTVVKAYGDRAEAVVADWRKDHGVGK